MKNLFYMLTICFMLAYHAQAQYNINRLWQKDSGRAVIDPLVNPAGLLWSASITDASGNIITTGHTNVSGQGENMMLKKVTPAGVTSFFVTWNSSGTNNDYGIALTKDASNNIYVVGTTDNANTSTNFDTKIWKYNASGVLQFSLTYAGTANLNDIGTGIALDASGNILMLCTTQNTATSYDYHLAKYSSTGTALWSSNYDYNSLPDVPLGLSISGGTIMVAGASASTTVKWDYAVVNFNASTGIFINTTRTNLPGIGYSQPYAFKRDAAQNTYITGKGSTDGVNYNVFTAKVAPPPTFSLVWTQTVDLAGGEDVGSAIDLDVSGNILVGGYTTKSNGRKQLSVFKYSNAGVLQWEYDQSSRMETADAFVKALCSNGQNDFYFTGGETGLSGKKEVLVGRISSAGSSLWERSIKSNVDNVPADITLTTDGLLVSSLKTTTAGNSYQTTAYGELAFDTNRIYNAGKVLCKQNELIVRFNRSALNTSAIDNNIGTKVAEYGDLRDFMNATQYAAVVNTLSAVCPSCTIKAVKVFKDLPTTYTTTVSRQGQTIAVPDFWTALVLVFPSGSNIKLIQNKLNTIPSIVNYCHPNYIAKFYSVPNDPYYHLWQHGLCYFGGVYSGDSINVEQAWDVVPSCGLPTVRGGVFDTGIEWKHEDFGYDGQIASTSKIIDGWNFENNTYLKSGNGEGPYDFHGTCVAGIIGAIRNNNKGIAGIAGGNYTLTTPNPGVSLYSLRIGGTQMQNGLGAQPFNATLNYIASAIVNSTFSGTISPYSYGLNFMNNSWGIQQGVPQYFTDTNITMLNDAVHQANRANVTIMAARGNDSAYVISYPALSDDDWVLTVGGYGDDGYRSNPYNGVTWTGYGNLDVCAPASHPLVFTTQNLNNAGYGQFGATSGATPFVSGVVGLLMSYMNDTSILGNYKNLSPEDCEQLIQRTATDVLPAGYDSLTGYGHLDAGKALRLVEKPYRDLKHFGTNSSSPYTISKSVYSVSDTVVLREAYENYTIPAVSFPRARYVVKTFKITATVNHNLPLSDTIKGSWPRPSSSAVLELFSTNKRLLPRERVVLNSCNNSNATLTGYIYQVKDTLGNPLGWWPCDTSFSCARLSNVFEYSILIRNNTPYVGIKKNIASDNSVTIYPNPTNGRQDLVIETSKEQDLTIDLYDLMGRHIKTVFSGKIASGETTITNDVSTLPNSMYFYTIKLDEDQFYKKFIKE